MADKQQEQKEQVGRLAGLGAGVIAGASLGSALLPIPTPVVPVPPMLPPVVDATQARTSLGISPATTGTWYYPTDDEENEHAPPAANQQPDNMRPPVPAPAPERQQQDPPVDRSQAATPAVTFVEIAVRSAAATEVFAGPLAKGPHGFTEILYAYTSATGNNGSAFAGLTANTGFYDTTLGIAMFLGRFFMIIPIMAIAGSLVQKKIVAASAGTFPTTGPLFVALLVGVILIVVGLTFFPALSLGPIVDHLKMLDGTTL